MANTSDIKNGMVLNHNNGLWQIVEFLHVKPGKGAAFVRTKLKNIETGKVVDNTFNAGHKIDPVRIEASGAGNGGLVVLQPGDVVDVTVPVHNDGNVVDTMLLDVNANPDLAGFWANWSSTGGSENVSNNQTGGTSTPSYEVLMYGNSYTAAERSTLEGSFPEKAPPP